MLLDSRDTERGALRPRGDSEDVILHIEAQTVDALAGNDLGSGIDSGALGSIVIVAGVLEAWLEVRDRKRH